MASRAAGISIEDAHRLFGPPVVRALLDWERLTDLQAPLSQRVVHSPDEIGRLSSTWYVDVTRGEETSYRDTDSRPLKISELRDHLAMLEPGRVERMRQIALTHRQGTGTWVVPCYALPGGDLLLLDGNHRIGAFALHGLAARLLAVVIHGPVQPEILPDLAAWA